MNKNSSNYKKYTNTNILMKTVISNFLNNIKKISYSINFDSVLDAGCGEGFVINYLNQKNVTGVDISKTALNIAKIKNPNCSFYNASVYDLPFVDNSFDLVIASEILEHLDNPEKAINEIKRVSTKYCIFSVPNEPYFRFMNFLRGKNITRFGNDIEHVQNWSSSEFVKLLDKNFDVMDVKKPYPWTVVLCKN